MLCLANVLMVVLVVWLVVFMVRKEGLQMISHLIITAIILITTLIIIVSLPLHRVIVLISKVVDFPVGGML